MESTSKSLFTSAKYLLNMCLNKNEYKLLAKQMTNDVHTIMIIDKINFTFNFSIVIALIFEL